MKPPTSDIPRGNVEYAGVCKFHIKTTKILKLHVVKYVQIHVRSFAITI